MEEGKDPLRKDVVRWYNQNKFHVKKMTGYALGLSIIAPICLGQRLHVCVAMLHTSSVSSSKTLRKLKRTGGSFS